MTHLRVSPQLHKALVSESRRKNGNQLITLAGYGSQNDPDVVVFELSVANKHSRGSLDAARFDPVVNGCALRC
jgi:hypothetical protein